MSMYEKALDAWQDGRLNRSVIYDGPSKVELFCYSRDVFLSGEWDEVTVTHRGKMYLDGRSINHVFPKIFNLNEVPATSLSVVKERFQNNEPYIVMDKSNGHLVIASHDFDSGEWYITTKGLLQSEMIDNDRRVFEERGYLSRMKTMPSGATLMFEALTDEDPHTLHKEQKAMYSQDGEDVMVLLGGYWSDGYPMDMSDLHDYAESIGCPLVKLYDKGDIDTGNIMSLFDHKGIEGYVFWFPDDDFRVKIKTKEYWELRFRKDLTPKRLVAMYCNQGPDAMLRKLPEEIDRKVMDAVEDLAGKWYIIHHVDILSIHMDAFGWSGRELHTSDRLTDAQKIYLQKRIYNGPESDENVYIGGSRKLRKAFHDHFMNSAAYKMMMESKLQHILD